jgi:integrase/recombinase XerD
MLEKLFAEYLREKQYLSCSSPTTIKYLGWVFNRWRDIIGEMPTKQNTKEWVMKLCESDISHVTVNSYIRGFNTFLTWLYENEHTENIRIKKIKEGKRGIKTYSEADIKKMLSYRPKTFAQHRLHSMICFAVDTGCRIDEMLSLNRSSLDFDNLLVTVIGKGDKERIIPISVQCRKILYKFLKRHESDVVFPNRDGAKLDYKTSLDQLKTAFKPMHVSWHKFRHSFATYYVRDGGNVFFLQQVLGHTDLQTTKIYISNQTDNLKLVHKKTSLLNRLK